MRLQCVEQKKIRLTGCDRFEYSAPPVRAAIVRGSTPAQVAELVDARRSGRRVLADVRVRVSPWAPNESRAPTGALFFGVEPRFYRRRHHGPDMDKIVMCGTNVGTIGIVLIANSDS